MGKWYVTCRAPVLVEVDKELDQRHISWLIYCWHPLYLDTDLAVSAKTCTLFQVVLMKGKWKLLVLKPSRTEVDSLLLKTIRTSHIVVSACNTWLVFLVIVRFYLMPCQWVWVMAGTIKLRKYNHVHNTAKLLQVKVHALSLNVQMSTNRQGSFLYAQEVKWYMHATIIFFWHLKHLLISRLLISKNKMMYCISVDFAAIIPVRI